MIISLYAGGMTVRDIGHHLQRTLGTELSHDTISKITDAVVEEVKAWQSRPLEEIYPIVYLDALVVKVRDGHTVGLCIESAECGNASRQGSQRESRDVGRDRAGAGHQHGHRHEQIPQRAPGVEPAGRCRRITEPLRVSSSRRPVLAVLRPLLSQDRHGGGAHVVAGPGTGLHPQRRGLTVLAFPGSAIMRPAIREERRC